MGRGRQENYLDQHALENADRAMELRHVVEIGKAIADGKGIQIAHLHIIGGVVVDKLRNPIKGDHNLHHLGAAHIRADLAALGGAYAAKKSCSILPGRVRRWCSARWSGSSTLAHRHFKARIEAIGDHQGSLRLCMNAFDDRPIVERPIAPILQDFDRMHFINVR